MAKTKLTLSLFLLLTLAEGAVATDYFSATTDVDLSFLLSHPKLNWGNDPFLKLPGFMEIANDRQTEKLSLGGIAWTEKSPVAVINGKAVKEGDRIGGQRVVAIGPNYVVLEKGRYTTELTLPPIINDEEEDKE